MMKLNQDRTENIECSFTGMDAGSTAIRMSRSLDILVAADGMDNDSLLPSKTLKGSSAFKRVSLCRLASGGDFVTFSRLSERDNPAQSRLAGCHGIRAPPPRPSPFAPRSVKEDVPC